MTDRPLFRFEGPDDYRRIRDALAAAGYDEAQLAEGYKEAILAARCDQTVRAAFVNELVPPASQGAYATAPRVVRNAFIDRWHGHEDDVRRMRDQLVDQMRAAMREGRVHELLVIAGAAAGAIDEVLPAAEIVRQMTTEAQDVIRAFTPA